MQRLRSNQQRNRRVALLHEKTEISNNEPVEVQNKESESTVKQDNNGLKLKP
jgi:hypothetical protein